MNNRDYKDFTKNEIYHIYNRGVGRMDIFLDQEDYIIFLTRLKENLFPELNKKDHLPKYLYRRKSLPPDSFHLLSYCLMPNHFHILIKQNTDLPITKLVLKICTGYSKYFNKKYTRVGSIFQDKFKSVLIENNEQLLWTSFYIHTNPIKAEIVTDLNKYQWSSYPDYAGLRNGILCKKDLILNQFKSKESYLQEFKNKKTSQEINIDLMIDNDGHC